MLVPVLYIVTVETGLYISHNLSLSRLSVNTYFYLKVFLFGATVTGLLTSVGKLTIGRLRPHFISVCGPDMEFTEASCGSQENPRYITHFTCTGQDQDKIQDARSIFSSPSILIKHLFKAEFSLWALERSILQRCVHHPLPGHQDIKSLLFACSHEPGDKKIRCHITIHLMSHLPDLFADLRLVLRPDPGL